MKSIISALKFIVNHPLGWRGKVSSIARYLAWQIRSNLYSEYHVVPWIEGQNLKLKEVTLD